jgi:hypothetical protein
LGFLGLLFLVTKLLLFFIKTFLFGKLKYIVARFYIVIILVISGVFGIAIEFVTSYILLLYPFVSRIRGYFLIKTSNTKGKFYLSKSLFRVSRCYDKKKGKP